MHYGWSAFGNGAMTIKTKDPKYQYAIGQDENFSKMDVIQINKMYQCSKCIMDRKIRFNNSILLLPIPYATCGFHIDQTLLILKLFF